MADKKVNKKDEQIKDLKKQVAELEGLVGEKQTENIELQKEIKQYYDFIKELKNSVGLK